MVEVLKQCDTCRILSIEDLPVMESRKKFSGVIEGLVKRHGTSGHTLFLSMIFILIGWKNQRLKAYWKAIS